MEASKAAARRDLPVSSTSPFHPLNRLETSFSIKPLRSALRLRPAEQHRRLISRACPVLCAGLFFQRFCHLRPDFCNSPPPHAYPPLFPRPNSRPACARRVRKARINSILSPLNSASILRDTATRARSLGRKQCLLVIRQRFELPECSRISCPQFSALLPPPNSPYTLSIGIWTFSVTTCPPTYSHQPATFRLFAVTTPFFGPAFSLPRSAPNISLQLHPIRSSSTIITLPGPATTPSTFSFENPRGVDNCDKTIEKIECPDYWAKRRPLAT